MKNIEEYINLLYIILLKLFRDTYYWYLYVHHTYQLPQKRQTNILDYLWDITEIHFFPKRGILFLKLEFFNLHNSNDFFSLNIFKLFNFGNIRACYKVNYLA